MEKKGRRRLADQRAKGGGGPFFLNPLTPFGGRAAGEQATGNHAAAARARDRVRPLDPACRKRRENRGRDWGELDRRERQERRLSISAALFVQGGAADEIADPSRRKGNVGKTGNCLPTSHGLGLCILWADCRFGRLNGRGTEGRSAFDNGSISPAGHRAGKSPAPQLDAIGGRCTANPKLGGGGGRGA